MLSRIERSCVPGSRQTTDRAAIQLKNTMMNLPTPIQRLKSKRAGLAAREETEDDAGVDENARSRMEDRTKASTKKQTRN
jgi:hypothetical protein